MTTFGYQKHVFFNDILDNELLIKMQLKTPGQRNWCQKHSEEFEFNQLLT
jgi:hypothetical protein